MKISTITCHTPFNYGAVLQAYALQRFFILKGHKVEIIDYRPDYLTRNTKLLYVGGDKYKRNLIIKALYILRFLPSRLKARRSFSSFLKNNLSLTNCIYTCIDELVKNPPKSDIYYCGSDQIWNFNLQNGRDEAFYLSFIDDNIKKNAYAASISISSIKDKDALFLKTHLKDFNFISVREDVTAEYLSEILDRPVTHVLDPVFLLPKGEWDKVKETSSINCGKSPYLLIYAMGDNSNIYNIASQIAKRKGLRIYEISASLRKHPFVNKTFRGVTPASFLQILSGASYIVTNSFHGTSFSLIFNKQFTVCDIANTNIRLFSILRTTRLEDRFSEGGSVKIPIEEIDYKKVNELLEMKIRDSKNFLNDSLSGRQG